MMNFTENKDYTANTIKNEIKNAVIENIMNELRNIYGNENVGMGRLGTSTSKKNEIVVKAAMVDVNGTEVPACVTISVTAKPYTDSPATAKRKYTAFDFDAAIAEYEDYIEQKAIKEAEKADAKKKKIQKDETARKKAFDNVGDEERASAQMTRMMQAASEMGEFSAVQEEINDSLGFAP